MHVCVQPAALCDSAILTAIDDDGVAARFHSTLLTEWLPGKTVGACLYRGSVHGLTPAAFHERCDGKGPTLTLIRADEGDRIYVFGGYTGASWSSPARGTQIGCRDTFLFSVIGPGCTVTRFPMKDVNCGIAIWCYAGWGPVFGFVDLVVRSLSESATDEFDELCECINFKFNRGVFANTLGVGKWTFTGTNQEMGSFIPVDIEVYAVV